MNLFADFVGKADKDEEVQFVIGYSTVVVLLLLRGSQILMRSFIINNVMLNGRKPDLPLNDVPPHRYSVCYLIMVIVVCFMAESINNRT